MHADFVPNKILVFLSITYKMELVLAGQKRSLLKQNNVCLIASEKTVQDERNRAKFLLIKLELAVQVLFEFYTNTVLPTSNPLENLA